MLTIDSEIILEYKSRKINMLLDEIKKIIEALLFMKGEEGLNIEYFSTFMEVEPHEAEICLMFFVTSTIMLIIL